jgi:hypothetical protein
VKIDIEGGEMAALTEILSAGTLARLSVKQLLVEFHLWDDEHFSSFVHIIGLLRQQGYLIFRKEFNPLDSSRCAEFSFLGTRWILPCIYVNRRDAFISRIEGVARGCTMAAGESEFDFNYRRLRDLAETLFHEIDVRGPELRNALDRTSNVPEGMHSHAQHAAKIYHEIAQKIMALSEQFKETGEAITNSMLR